MKPLAVLCEGQRVDPNPPFSDDRFTAMALPSSGRLWRLHPCQQ
jgi:hypothetical protein